MAGKCSRDNKFNLELSETFLGLFFRQINAKKLYQADSVPPNIIAIIDPAEIPYFYRPIMWDEDMQPLANLVIVFSLYASDERFT